MTYIKNAFFLLLCMAAGVGLAKGYLYWRAHPGADFSHTEGSLVTGTGDAPGYRGFILQRLPPDLPNLLDNWRNCWATTLALEYSPSLTRPVLAAAVRAAHSRQIAVILLPPLVPAPGNPYPHPLAAIAADAQAARVDRFCISWLSEEPDAVFWRQQEAAIRAVYKGKLILAATPDVLPLVTCWDVADFIGVAGPVPLPRRLPHASDNVSPDDFRAYWSSQITSYESFGKLHEKSIALLNLQVPLNVSFKLPLAGRPEPRMPANAALQSAVYEALLTETKGRAALTDILLLSWSDSNPSAVNQVPGLLPRLTAAWDPKKPRPPETLPFDDVDPTLDMPVEAEAPAATTP